MHDDETADADKQLQRYFDALNADAVQAPAALRRQILARVPDEPPFDAWRWLLLPWWRPALTAAAPLALGFALGFFSPLDNRQADDTDWLLEAAFGQTVGVGLDTGEEIPPGEHDDAS